MQDIDSFIKKDGGVGIPFGTYSLEEVPDSIQNVWPVAPHRLRSLDQEYELLAQLVVVDFHKLHQHRRLLQQVLLVEDVLELLQDSQANHGVVEVASREDHCEQLR